MLHSLLVGLYDSSSLLELGWAGKDVERIDCLHKVPGSAPVGALVVPWSGEVYVDRRVDCPAPVQRCWFTRGVSTTAAGSTKSSFGHLSGQLLS